MWDFDLLAELFNEEDRRQIMNIPLTALGREDRVLWSHYKKGTYSVKSGYKRLMEDSFLYSHTATDNYWSKLWHLKVPAKVRNLIWRASLNVLPTIDQLRAKRVDVDSRCPVCHLHEESVLHTLVLCEFAQKVWEAAGVNSSSPTATNFKEWLIGTLEHHNQEHELIVMIAWAIWTNRNEAAWKGKSYTVLMVVANAKNFLQQWHEANQPLSPLTATSNSPGEDKWKPPPVGYFKLNVDAAIFENQGKAGLGLVIRDELGSFVAARIVPVQGIVDPLIAEALGVREALSWIKSSSFEVRTVELDALMVYTALQNKGVDNSYFGAIIEECRLLARDLPNLNFHWVRRLANQVAHTLAKAAYSFHDRVGWSYFPPLFISNVLLADSMNE
ncbi:unnamed protein product [Fraxinus pennsylvanica]|uniref:Uncharacterized protein n=1 Tax=Fraxinus pennsylvanica TaxID=56036 RepID=A0AAD2DJ00_9LAMI|nr:unnamed protein product [Fraxinus pennsylvanica]